MRFAKLLLLGALVAAAADVPLIEPASLAPRLAEKPVILYVGPNVLYRSKHIPAAIYAGPTGKPEGLELLKAAVAKLPHDREIVIYCGCCPWDRCPNVKPAIALLQQMGFTNAKVLHLPEYFKTDWIDKGYPVESGGAN